MGKDTILYIGGFELPDKNAAAHRVLSNGKILKELGYNVLYIDIDKSLNYNSSISETKKSYKGFEYWSLPYPKTKKQWLTYLTNIDFFKVINYKCNPKIVIAYNYPAIALRRLNKYCINNNIIIIGDCTEWYNTKGSNLIFKIIKGLDSFLRMRIFQKKLDGLIVISSFLERYYSKSNKLICIPPLVDSLDSKWSISANSSNDNKIRFVYSGSPVKNKEKLNIFIENLYNLYDSYSFIFYVVGISKTQYLMNYKHHVEIISKMSNSVKFLGRLSHVESLNYVKRSDFSIIIRDNDRMTKAGFPTKFVEAMNCGTPVISTKISDLDRYIIEGLNGYFIDIYNDRESTELLKKVLSLNKIQISKMKKNCNFQNDFHFENYKQPMEKFLSDVIK